MIPVYQKLLSVPTGVPNVTSTKMHPNVEKRTQRDRSRCDDMRYWTKITFYVPTVSREPPNDDSDHAKCG